MGQYHLTCNLTKREFLDPHKLGDGLKLLEQASSQYGTMAALWGLIAAPQARGGGDFDTHPLVGRWHGDRIALVGDYADQDDLPSRFNAHNIYEDCRDVQDGRPSKWKDISELAASFLIHEFHITLEGTGWRTRNVEGKEAQVGRKPDLAVEMPTALSQDERDALLVKMFFSIADLTRDLESMEEDGAEEEEEDDDPQ